MTRLNGWSPAAQVPLPKQGGTNIDWEHKKKVANWLQKWGYHHSTQLMPKAPSSVPSSQMRYSQGQEVDVGIA